MIDALNKKLQVPGAPTNLKAIAEIFDDPDTTHLQGQKVDYVFSHLTLHHIVGRAQCPLISIFELKNSSRTPQPNLKETITHLVDALAPNGHVVFSDFEAAPHSSQFHPKAVHDEVHRHGIDADEIRQLLVDAGLQDVRVEHSFDIDKAVDDAVWSRSFGFLVCIGRRAE